MGAHYDIVISGGGIAGLCATSIFGALGFDVLCVDPSAPVLERDAPGADIRTTAFLQPAKARLSDAGLWDRLADYAMPLQKMRIMDASGPGPDPKARREFDANDVSDQPFGWNLPNWLLRREITAYVQDLPNVTLLNGVSCTSMMSREAEALVHLSDGKPVKTRLVIAADGRHSTLRQHAGIGVKTIRFGQKALAFAVTHPNPHDNVSTEIHQSGGPFTLVPLPDRDGRPSSAVVWMEDGPKANALMDLDEASFNTAISERSCYLLGPLEQASRRTIWPIIAQGAERLTTQRLALIAEAAHVVPPIGAQGLNMSLNDMAALADLAAARPEGLGDSVMLAAYERARLPDIKTRIAGISMLNRASQTGLPMLQAARAEGLKALHDVPPIRHALMQMGLGSG